MVSLFSKLLDRRIASYQADLIETHYREVDTPCIKKCAAGGTITATTYKP